MQHQNHFRLTRFLPTDSRYRYPRSRVPRPREPARIPAVRRAPGAHATSTPQPSVAPAAWAAAQVGRWRLNPTDRGRGPRTPAIPGFCTLFVRSPRRALGLCALVPVPGRRRQGGAGCPARAWRSGASLRPPRPCAAAPSRALCARPLGPSAGGVGWGSLPSLSPAPGGRFRRSRRRGGGGSLRLWVRFGGGVSWFVFACLAVPASCRSFAWFSVPFGAGSRRGAVPPWVCRSAVRVARCRGLSRSRGFPRSPPLRASRCPGVGGFPPAPAFAWCARWPVGLRFPCRCAPACRRAGRGCALWWSLVRLSRVLPLPLPFPLGGSRRRGVFRLAPARAGVRPARGRRGGVALAAGRSVAVGCAAGADSFVRAAAPGALVFSVAAFGSGRGAFAVRSVALVRAVAAGGPGSGFVVFPSTPCPAGLSPSARSSACFCGSGSGSWASAAFAAGLGFPLVVFPCGFPPSSLPPWGLWVPAGSGVWAVGFRLVR